MKEKNFFAVDLGATSGRTIIGRLADGRIEQRELTRFDNQLIETGGRVYWDIFALYNEIIKGLRRASEEQITIASIGIDTWGVDFVCFGADGAPMRNPRAYRDPFTFGAMDDYFDNVLDKQTVYRKTGIQFMNFNSLFQLYAMRLEADRALEHAGRILFVPDALTYMLTGNMVCERTIASTSQMLDPRTGRLDRRLLASVGLSPTKFGRMVEPGTTVGTITDEVQRLTGLGPVPVVAVAGHDTASAVAAVPAKNPHFAYLSSGTWSLMGIESPEPIISDQSYERNFTNEGGVMGTTRFLKNICGMWIYERCRAERPEMQAKSHAELQQAAAAEPTSKSIIEPDDPRFANPDSMVEAISNYCREKGMPVPETDAQLCRCIFDSLAHRYQEVFGWLREMAPFPIEVLHIIGGGSKNDLLNQLTADACGVPVVAGPMEGTALGNIMLQAKAAGDATDLWQMRQLIAQSIETKRYEPNKKHQQ